LGYRAYLWNLRITYKLKLPHPTEGGANELPLKDRRKTGETQQPPDETKRELLLKYQHQDWMLKE
jgi:hypothetical protein